MRIIDLKLTNFRKISSFQEPTIILHPDINVLVGANNAGKTSILKAVQKIFSTEKIEAEKDLNYLVSDGVLTLEAKIKLTKEQWASFLKIANNEEKENLFSNKINFERLSSIISNYPIILNKKDTYINRNLSSSSTSATIPNKEALENHLHLLADLQNKSQLDLYNAALHQIAHCNFYNVYKTPLYLDSKGEILEKEPFVALNKIEKQQDPKKTNIRGLLYALKKKSPEQFEDFKKRLLRIFTELDDIDVVHNEDVGEFQLVLHEKLRQNGNFADVQYDIKNVGQGMQSLVIMLSTILLLQPSIVLMDEPEVHMHPSLIKEFVQYLKVLSIDTQFIITTHSLVLVNEVGLDKVFSLKNDIEQKGIIISPVDDRNKLLEAVRDLGYTIDNLTATLKPNVFVFTEGVTDKDIILSFAEKCGHSKVINPFSTAFVDMGGKGNRYKLAELINKINKDFIDVPILMILDRDETQQVSIEDIRNKFFAHNPKRLHYLSKRQIENYLIDVDSIAITVNEKLTKQNPDKKISLAQINKKIGELVEDQKDKITDNYLTETFIQDSVIGTAHVRDLIKSLVKKPLNEAVPQFTGELFKLVGMRTALLGQKTTSSLEEFEKKWGKDKLEMIDGRDLLKGLRRWFQDEYKVTFSNEEIIAKMKKVPDEINKLLDLLLNPNELKL